MRWMTMIVCIANGSLIQNHGNVVLINHGINNLLRHGVEGLKILRFRNSSAPWFHGNNSCRIAGFLWRNSGCEIHLRRASGKHFGTHYHRFMEIAPVMICVVVNLGSLSVCQPRQAWGLAGIWPCIEPLQSWAPIVLLSFGGLHRTSLYVPCFWRGLVQIRVKD